MHAPVKLFYLSAYLGKLFMEKGEEINQLLDNYSFCKDTFQEDI
jgi:hypothetical protein